MSLHYRDNSYNSGNSYLVFKRKGTFKTNNKTVNFPTEFSLGSISNGFGATESREVSLKENVYGCSVDCNLTY